MPKLKGHIDWFILLPVAGLMLFSLSFVYSASWAFADHKFDSTEVLFFNHLWRVLVGLVVIIVFSRIDYHFYRKISKPLMTIAIIMLVAVLIVGSSAKGATRWLDLGPIRIQPSEILKFALVIHFASMLAAKQKEIKYLYEGFLPFAIWTGMACFLIALQPNFSTMMVVFVLSFSMMFVGNINLIHLGTTGIVGFIGASIYAVSESYRLKRILSFLGLEENTAVGYQLNQSLIALGNGGLTGVGPGQSKQSMFFLPESYGDFIFAIIGEEFGFIGLLLILGAFALIFWRGLLIAKKAPDNFGYYLATGITITFALYVIVNAAVNTGLAPTTGVPFPFISYGGTAILLYSSAIGILLNVSAQAGVYPKAESIDNDIEVENEEEDDED